MQSTPSAAARRSHRSRRAAPRGRGSAHACACISQAAKITYLHNSLGQRVFKSEPQTAQTLPDEQTLGTGFVDWLRRNFQWLYASAQTNASIGTAYSFADQSLPSWALLGEYDNGSASGAGRVEYIWLPTDDGSAIPVAMFRGSRYWSIHSDHLGTPRLIKDDAAKPTWQWAYSAFGDNKPTGILKATTNPNAAITNQPTLLQATGAMEFNLRFPGQYLDQETGQFYNYYRTYMPNQGRYTQNDPIGLDGGWNRYQYVEGNPLSYTDPEGLAPDGHHWVIGPIRHDPNLSPAAAQVFKDAKTGYYGERHGWSKPHSEYNKGVQDLWNSKKFDPPNMSKAQAQDFVRDVMRSSDPRVADYRRTIINQCLTYGMRRGSWTRGGNE